MKRWLAANEYIICSAIHFRNGKEYDHQPININTGFVVAGRRHHNCYQTAYILGYNRHDSTFRNCEGFITSKDRFVNRTEGLKIAKTAGQTDVDNYLISENLY